MTTCLFNVNTPSIENLSHIPNGKILTLSRFLEDYLKEKCGQHEKFTAIFNVQFVKEIWQCAVPMFQVEGTPE